MVRVWCWTGDNLQAGWRSTGIAKQARVVACFTTPEEGFNLYTKVSFYR